MTKARFSAAALFVSAALASQSVLADKGVASAAAVAPSISATGMISASELPGAWDTDAKDAKTVSRQTRLREHRDIKRKMQEFGLPAAIVSH